jgi:hypothetical protein
MEAYEHGQQVLATNFRTGGEATRYVHPITGTSVIIDDVTGEIIQVGRADFNY